MAEIPAELLQPQVPDARQAPPLRWGIMGPGWIAERFIAALQRHTTQNVAAVGSRDAGRARAMAERLGIPRAHGAYEDLVADPDVDIIYVATPHTAHRDGAILALEAGKHVLVEKPLALNAAQAREVADAARASGRFCMEALWTFFLPKYEVLARVVREGWIGDVRTVLADHGEYFDGDHRILRADLAGGPMLDLGTYPVALATWLLGDPTGLHASMEPHPTAGVHGQVGAALDYAGGHQALLHTSILNDTPIMATIGGTRGTLILDGAFFMPGRFTLRLHDGPTATYEEPPAAHDALYYQAAAVARSIAAGETENAARPLADSIATLTVMDAIRERVGIVFPGEAG